jgi:hypothetical protein
VPAVLLATCSKPNRLVSYPKAVTLTAVGYVWPVFYMYCVPIRDGPTMTLADLLARKKPISQANYCFRQNSGVIGNVCEWNATLVSHWMGDQKFITSSSSVLRKAAFAVVTTHQPAQGPRGYGPFSLCIIHKKGLCPSSGDINRLMMMIIGLWCVQRRVLGAPLPRRNQEPGTYRTSYPSWSTSYTSCC